MKSADTTNLVSLVTEAEVLLLVVSLQLHKIDLVDTQPYTVTPLQSDSGCIQDTILHGCNHMGSKWRGRGWQFLIQTVLARAWGLGWARGQILLVQFEG
jgi:hypothetical protein